MYVQSWDLYCIYIYILPQQNFSWMLSNANNWFQHFRLTSGRLQYFVDIISILRNPRGLAVPSAYLQSRLDQCAIS